MTNQTITPILDAIREENRGAAKAHGLLLSMFQTGDTGLIEREADILESRKVRLTSDSTHAQKETAKRVRNDFKKLRQHVARAYADLHPDGGKIARLDAEKTQDGVVYRIRS